MDATIDVDLFNPGQVFACLGLAELADVLVGGAEGAFCWNGTGPTRFTVRVPGSADPIAEARHFFANAKVSSLAPAGSRHETEKWQVPTIRGDVGEPFSIPEPDSPATLPALLEATTSQGTKHVAIDHWGDRDAGRDAVKFWAGAGGCPGSRLARDALDLIRSRAGTVEDLFSIAAPQSSSFRLDWRRDYIPIDIGFSLNAHAKMQPRGYPAIELLGAIGLSHARPERQTNLKYRYGVIGAASAQVLPLSFLRAALGVPQPRLPFPTRTFQMKLGWPGQEGQARSITTVTEEIPA